MTTYARIEPSTGLVRDTISLTDAQFHAFDGNPKQAFLRPLVIDAQPGPTTSQAVVDAGHVIEATQVRQTWVLRNKTQAELDADAQSSELTALRTMVAALTTDIQAGITAAPTTTAQAFAAIQDLKRRALRTDRAIRWLLKQQ